KPADALGDQLGMLDQNRRMADHAGDEALVPRKLRALPHLPFVLMARIGRFEGVGAGANAQDDIHHMLELEIVDTRPHVDAVAGMKISSGFIPSSAPLRLSMSTASCALPR